MSRDDSAGGSGLPAPYRNPWLALRDAGLAVVADLRLRLRELLRRNGEGGLWRPGWWSQDLAPLFWPMLAAAALALLAGGLALLLKLMTPVHPPAQPPDPPLVLEQAPDRGSSQEPEPLGPLSPAEPSMPPVPAAAPPLAVPAEEPDPQAARNEAEAPLPHADDPLGLLLERPEAVGVIAAAAGDAETGTLTLRLASGFERLSPQDQRRRAELWQLWARDLGYDHLELRDPRSGLRGRDARVGEGMILFSPQPPP